MDPSGTARLRRGFGSAFPKKGRGRWIGGAFEVHAYRDGDPLQRVHWKLTAKTGEMLVREFNLPKREVLLLQVDLYHPPQEKWDHCKLERLLEQTADLLEAFGDRTEYEVFWQGAERSYCRMQISRAPELWAFLKRLCLTATKEELEQNGKPEPKQSGKIEVSGRGSFGKGQRQRCNRAGSRRAALENRCRRNSQAGERQ